jgi:isoaspartyl peptidase/L-asparaginase-like protein (Ntn-hydrolase superfamily)
VGAVSLSGDGESLIRTTLAARVIHRLEASCPLPGDRRRPGPLAEVGGEAGLIVIDAEGRMGWNHNSAQFAVAHASAERPPKAFVNRRQDPTRDAP